MTTGRIPSPQKSAYRGYKDQFDGTIPPVKVTPASKDAAIVLTKISLRPGDNRDILEMLGLVPAGVAS